MVCCCLCPYLATCVKADGIALDSIIRAETVFCSPSVQAHDLPNLLFINAPFIGLLLTKRFFIVHSSTAS